MSKKTYIVGDIHGAGQELQGLLDVIGLGADDELVSVGDCFDRGLHADLVWKLLAGKLVFMGNHEYKMLQWMKGEFDFLPHYYYVALNLLVESGVSPTALYDWLQARPMLQDRGSFLITHGGVVLDRPELENLSMNVYYMDGRNLFEADSGYVYDKKNPQVLSRPEFGKNYWWDVYQGDKLVVYGHLVTGDDYPRIRRNHKGKVNSVGLDTAAVHGGALTAYCPEDDKFFSYKSGIDWGSQCLAQIKEKPPLVNPDLMAFVRASREALKSQSASGTPMAVTDGEPLSV